MISFVITGVFFLYTHMRIVFIELMKTVIDNYTLCSSLHSFAHRICIVFYWIHMIQHVEFLYHSA